MELVSDVRLNIPVDVTFTEFVLRRAEQFGDRLALVDGATGRSYTYCELRRDVIRCAAALYDLGLRHGDRVCILLQNCVEYLVVMLAVLRLGAICVPTNYMYTKYELYDMTVDCEPTFYVSTGDRIDDIIFATTSLSNERLVVIVVGDDAALSCCHSDRLRRPTVSFESLLRQQSDHTSRRDDLPHTSVDDNRHLVALICYSSGTTGKPKGCMQTHHALIANGCMNNALLFASHFRSLSSGDVTVTSPADEVTVVVLPLFHAFAIEMYLTHALTVGLKVVTVPRFNCETFLQVVEQYKATLLHVVPPLLSALLNNIDEQRIRRSMSSVRLIMSGAVCLNDRLAQRMTECVPNVGITQLYGMTEILASHCAPPDTYKQGSIGRVMANVAAKVVDVESGTTLGPNIDGELVIKSPCVLTGYWRNEQATRSSFDDDGWFKTGDIGHYDEEGNFFIVDRIKDMMKYKGHAVAPAELESVLLLHPDVIDAAVAGVKDDTVGDLPRAYVITKTLIASTDGINQFVNERVAPYKRLRAGIKIVDHIPRGPSGKILRRLLAETETSKL